MSAHRIYIAATGQHVGKTTVTLGLVAAINRSGVKVTYCKPVGQKFLDIQNLRVDKDTLLFAELIHFELNPDLHSPVILGPGATTAYLDHPEKFPLKTKLLHAAEQLSKDHELVVFEGTGHPGVGSIADVSNAEVANLVKASVIMVVEGGIGSTIDELNMCLALFRELQVPILGVIINKVLPEKLEKIKKYVGQKLQAMNLPLLGLIPYDRSLAYPLMKSVGDAINGVVQFNELNLDNIVEDIVAGSLIELKELKSSNNILLVVSIETLDKAIKKIEFFSKMLKMEHSPLSGIVTTGEGEINSRCKTYIRRYNIPVVHTALDTYGAVIKISRIEVKINLQTPWKIKRAVELIAENINLNPILEKIKQKDSNL